MKHMLSPVFAIGTIHIGLVEGASCVNLGNNWPTNFRSYKKQNQGFGSVSGNNNVLSSLRSILHDPDTYDMMSVPPSDIPDWASGLFQENEEESEDSELVPPEVQKDDSVHLREHKD